MAHLQPLLRGDHRHERPHSAESAHSAWSMHACRSGHHSSLVPNKYCHVSGGWGDFFATGNDQLPNWTPEAEREEGKECVRIKAQDVVDMLHKLDVGTMELDAVAATKVSYTRISSA